MFRSTSSILYDFWKFLLDIKHHKASGRNCDDKLWETLARETRGRVEDVARLCFDSLEKGMYVFSESLLKEYDLNIADLTKLGPVDVATRPKGDRSLSFIHTIFQEYCAGMYIVEKEAALIKVLNEWRGGTETTVLFQLYQNSLIYASGIDRDLLTKVDSRYLRLSNSTLCEESLIDLSIESCLIHECENECTRDKFIDRIKTARVSGHREWLYEPDIDYDAYETFMSRLGYRGCLEIVARVYPERDENNSHLAALPPVIDDSDNAAADHSDANVDERAQDNPPFIVLPPKNIISCILWIHWYCLCFTIFHCHTSHTSI